MIRKLAVACILALAGCDSSLPTAGENAQPISADTAAAAQLESEADKLEAAADAIDKIDHSAGILARIKTTPPHTVVAVDPPSLVAAFAENEVGAKRLLNERIVELSGIIGSISLDLADRPTLNFDVAGTMTGVTATLGKGNDNAAGDLVKGQSVVIRCSRVDEIMGAPLLDDCVLPSR